VSEAFLVSGDLAFARGKLAAWKKRAIDAAAVGPLPDGWTCGSSKLRSARSRRSADLSP
jgi:hypothetical protein